MTRTPRSASSKPAPSPRAARRVDGLTTAERERPYSDNPALLEREERFSAESPDQLPLFAPGSMAIQQVINASPITGWIWIPGAGENGGTSERRTQVTLMAASEPAPASISSTVLVIFPPLAQRDRGLSTGAARS